MDDLLCRLHRLGRNFTGHFVADEPILNLSQVRPGVFNLGQHALPHDQASDAAVGELFSDGFVADLVVVEFLLPEIDARLGIVGVATAFVTMPEAAVDEDRSVVLLHPQIGVARDGFVVEPETKALAMQPASNDSLGLGILATDTGHHSGAGFFIDYVNHQAMTNFTTAEYFDCFGSKRISKTDKKKSAIVVTKSLRRVLDCAGWTPDPSGDTDTNTEFSLIVVAKDIASSARSSYYNSIRKPSKNVRTPETRLGRDLISKWLNVGDVLTLASVGDSVFALLEMDDQTAARIESGARLLSDISLARALSRPSEPKIVTTKAYNRNPFVVAAALKRADGHCEMPDCQTPLFRRHDGSNYLEVHHILPLAKGGPDSLDNVAALCPRCHRLLHFGADSDAKTKAVLRFIKSIS